MQNGVLGLTVQYFQVPEASRGWKTAVGEAEKGPALTPSVQVEVNTVSKPCLKSKTEAITTAQWLKTRLKRRPGAR